MPLQPTPPFRVTARSVDLTGQTFGRLLVQDRHHRDSRKQWHWRCLCVCGASAVVRTDNLTSGRTISCGCAKKELRYVEGPRRSIYNVVQPVPENAPFEAHVEAGPRIRMLIYDSRVRVLNGIMSYGFAVMEGTGIAGRLMTTCMARERTRGPVEVLAIRGMKVLADNRVIPLQGNRSIVQWMEDCGVVCRKSGMLDMQENSRFYKELQDNPDRSIDYGVELPAGEDEDIEP